MIVTHDKWCWNIDKRSQGSDGASMSLNPMGEFAMLHHEKDPVNEDFHDFRKKHNRVYKDKNGAPEKEAHFQTQFKVCNIVNCHLANHRRQTI